MTSVDLTADDIAWVKTYAAEVQKTFGQAFDAASGRFHDGKALLDRFNAAIEFVLNNGRGHFRGVDEAHNELCVAGALLANTKLKFIRLSLPFPAVPGRLISGRRPTTGKLPTSM